MLFSSDFFCIVAKRTERRFLEHIWLPNKLVAACCSSQVWRSKVRSQSRLHNNARWVCGSSTCMLPTDWKWASVWSCTGCFDEASDCIWIAFNHQNRGSDSADAKKLWWIKVSSLSILGSAQNWCYGIHVVEYQMKTTFKSFACEGINWKDTPVIRPGKLLWADTSICQAALLLVCSS